MDKLVFAFCPEELQLLLSAIFHFSICPRGGEHSVHCTGFSIGNQPLPITDLTDGGHVARARRALLDHLRLAPLQYLPTSLAW